MHKYKDAASEKISPFCDIETKVCFGEESKYIGSNSIGKRDMIIGPMITAFFTELSRVITLQEFSSL